MAAPRKVSGTSPGCTCRAKVRFTRISNRVAGWHARMQKSPPGRRPPSQTPTGPASDHTLFPTPRDTGPEGFAHHVAHERRATGC